ncbi:hypothetical protein LV89_02021 [Arcicella aurantiaca]|uniref:Uncharacterized protein n=1 Tax=Arcicella aurantiaca TaxID=591202 RepID=A0A316EVH8_9BACT|nr:hypothetical protein LV89_02021 [Arcicella aurantiaca]
MKYDFLKVIQWIIFCPILIPIVFVLEQKQVFINIKNYILTDIQTPSTQDEF